MKRADAVVCICEGLRDDVARRGIAPEKIFVAPNAVDASRFASDAPQTRSGSRTLGYAGSVRKLEGVDCFIRAGAQIIGAGFDASLLIVGDGPELDNVKALAARLDIAGRCLFTGAVPHAEMKSYYAMMDVFVISRPDIPVARVVTPLKPLEAMAAGRALVAPDMPSFREIVKDGETGLLYPAGDERALAEKCAALLRDEALRERLGRNAARWVRESRTWADAMKGTFAAYRFALGLTKNAPLSEDERSDAATSLLKAS